MDRFSFVKKIGQGAYGTVWKAVDQKTKRDVAIKIINTKFSTWQECLNLAEVRCLKKLRCSKKLAHPNIVTLYNVILENNILYLVFEWMEADLSDIIRAKGHPFSEEEVRNISFQLFKALTRMHKEGYCHRDLKPENLLVRGDVIKISDFGLSISIPNEAGRPLPFYIGTRPYRAPELLLGSTDYNFAIDIWSMGVILVQLFTRYPPFGGPNVASHIRKICSVIGSPNSHTWSRGLTLASSLNYSFPREFTNVDDSTKRLSCLIGSVSAQAIDLIKQSLSWDPKNRPKAIEALTHPFFYPCYNTNTPMIPPPLPKKLLESRYQSSINTPMIPSPPPMPQKLLESRYQSRINTPMIPPPPMPQKLLKSRYQSSINSTPMIPPPPLPQKLLQSNYQSCIRRHCEVRQYNDKQKPPNNAGLFSDLQIISTDSVSYNSYSVLQHNTYVGQFHPATSTVSESNKKPFQGITDSLSYDSDIARLLNTHTRQLHPATSTVPEFTEKPFPISESNKKLPFQGITDSDIARLLNTPTRQLDPATSTDSESTEIPFPRIDKLKITPTVGTGVEQQKPFEYRNNKLYPFPGMGPKQYKTTVKSQVPIDNINRPKRFGD